MIISPQAPPDIQPVPFDQKPLKLIGVPSKALPALEELGIKTLGDVPDQMDWSKFPGIGEKTALKIEEAFAGMKPNGSD